MINLDLGWVFIVILNSPWTCIVHNWFKLGWCSELCSTEMHCLGGIFYHKITLRVFLFFIFIYTFHNSWVDKFLLIFIWTSDIIFFTYLLTICYVNKRKKFGKIFCNKLKFFLFINFLLGWVVSRGAGDYLERRASKIISPRKQEKVQ